MKSFVKLPLLCAVMCAALSGEAKSYVHDTKYDWSGLANSITSPSKPDYEKARDIYTWLTKNISYDTSYSIHTADETYEQKRGVCQGYCEMFYRLGEAVGLRTDIIFGKSKNHDGTVSDMGHAWLFVYVDGNSGILVDPTWGAGGVDDGKFKSEPTDAWFNVSPEWLIFSHFPDEAEYQLLDSPLSFDSFRRISYLHPALRDYGHNGKELLASSLNGHTPQLPEYYSSAIARNTTGIKMPTEKELRVGTPYEFYVLPTGQNDFVIINGEEYDTDWVRSGKQAAIRFIPAAPGPLTVGVSTGESNYSSLVKYTVAQPTAQDIARLEEATPLRSPSLTGLTNYNRKTLENWGIDPHKLLAAVKAEGISTLPGFNANIESRAVDVPLNGRLKTGATYTFRFTPGKGRDFAAINDKIWIKDWTQNPDGSISLTVTPTVAGELKISAVIDDTNSFWPILTYTVD